LGPYILIGYSFGGLVALQMAQRLSQNGKQVALLAMLDTHPHPRYLPPAQFLRLMAQRAQFHIHLMRQLPFRGALAYVIRKVKGRLHVAGNPGDTESGTEAPGFSFSDAALRVKKKAYLAFASYRPGFYPSKIKYVATEIKSYFLPHDPVATWAHLAAEFEIDTIPGDHSEIIDTQREDLASVLTRYIQEATSEIFNSSAEKGRTESDDYALSG
jgi:acetoacetyl-CoA synthetase